MPQVRVEPMGLEFEADAGESLMAAADRAGYQWPTLCHGVGTCTICVTEVLAGGDGLAPVGTVEQAALSLLFPRPLRRGDLRLACQAIVEHDVVVEKRGVRVRPPTLDG